MPSLSFSTVPEMPLPRTVSDLEESLSLWERFLDPKRRRIRKNVIKNARKAAPTAAPTADPAISAKLSLQSLHNNSYSVPLGRVMVVVWPGNIVVAVCKGGTAVDDDFLLVVLLKRDVGFLVVVILSPAIERCA